MRSFFMSDWIIETTDNNAWNSGEGVWSIYNSADSYNGVTLASDDVNLTYNGGAQFEDVGWSIDSTDNNSWSIT